MKINLIAKYEAYARNAADYPGFLEKLSGDLGVSVAALQALGVGYAPLVEFKEGKKSQHWYATPERDSEGRVVGISLRGFTGTKVMLPGSKHGLVYPIRTGYRTGTKDYVSGRHNWVRTMDAGLPCPVCSKPDGCLLSAENPVDPKAVMCIRTKSGVPQQGDAGWLHVRKSEGMVNKGGPLPDSKHSIVSVEGASDSAAAFDLGFVPVGRPSNLAGMGLFKELVRGRPIILVGENDKKLDGNWPGKAGVDSAFENTKNICPSVLKVFPPEDCKDLREWKKKYDLTTESFLAYVKAHGSDKAESRDLDKKAPLDIAERWLKEEHTIDGIPVLRLLKNQWYLYNGTCYEEVDEDAVVRGRIYEWLKGRKYHEEAPDGSTKLVEFEATRSRVSDIIDALTCPCPVVAEPPCWLDGRSTPFPSDLVCFPNGVFDVATRSQGKSVDLVPSSPHFFTLHSLPYNYDPAATCPTWEAFLRQVLKDPKKIALFQEWFGLMLIPDTSFQKLLLMIGPPGSGKSTAVEVLCAMLGTKQVAISSLNSFGEKYGLQPCLGKLAIVFPDARIGKYADAETALQNVLNVSGADPVSVRRMAQPTLENVRLPGRITITTNELPELPDKAAALPRRMLALQFTETFTSNPDRGLPARLVAEVAGVLNWAIEGLVRLRYQGEFTEPESSIKVVEELKQTASPITQFSSECCWVKSECKVAEEELYDAWRNYAKDHALAGGMRVKFAGLLQMNIPTVRLVKDTKDGVTKGTWHGITLTPEGRNRYLVR